jgi:7,8-dihydropterin-6-yl-methyl-4-(beta-D-ribofuranosyl)aminobenzene 5'-phosphate synthase
MATRKKFGEIDNVEITILVDNWADMMLESSQSVQYFKERPLIAEHGFSALIDLKSANKRILWDTGMTPTAMLENMKRMNIDPKTIDQVVLSHGHGDHTAGMTEFLKSLEIKPKPANWAMSTSIDKLIEGAEWDRIPLIAHPAAFRERWSFPDKGNINGPVIHAPDFEWKAFGADIILSEKPYQLAPGCWVTGEVPRESFEKSGRLPSMRYRDGNDFPPDYIEDDQTIVINVKNKGLVILAGCAHAGIVNTVNYARRISGVNKIFAIMGGFHLAITPEGETKMTVEEIKKFQPSMIAPSHCTGFRAICRFAVEMPNEFTLGVVGTKYIF